MLRRWSLVSAAAAMALLVGTYQPALADSHMEDDAAMAGEATERMTLPSGALLISVPLEANLTSDLVFKPASVAPDLWYGLADNLSIGIIHSTYGTTGVHGSPVSATNGAGVCLTGEDNGCGKFYNNVGLDVRLSLLDGGLPLALNVGGHVLDLDGFTVAAKVGVVGKLGAGPLAILFSPNVFVGITDRTVDLMGVEIDVNKERINIPVSVVLGLGSTLSIGVQSGIQSRLSNFGDNYTVPVSIGARFMVSKLSVDVTITLPRVIEGAEDGPGTDARFLTAGVGFAL